MNCRQTIHHVLLFVVEHPCSLLGARDLLDFHNELGTRRKSIDSLFARRPRRKIIEWALITGLKQASQQQFLSNLKIFLASSNSTNSSTI